MGFPMRPKLGTEAHRAWCFHAFREACARLGKEPFDVRISSFESAREEDDECWPNFRDWSAVGGFARCRSLVTLSDESKPIEVMGTVRATTRELLYTRKLERDLGDQAYSHQYISDQIIAHLREHPPVLSKLAKPKPAANDVHECETVLFLSDLHFGLIVDPLEVPGAGYDWAIAAKNLAHVVDQAATFKPHHRDRSKLRVLLGGDIIEGEIHGQGPSIWPLAEQVTGARQMLTSAIDYLRHHYTTIEVVCVPGNHGRWPQRHGRAVSQKWDGLVSVLYDALAATFRLCDDVTFSIPRTPYATWLAPGGVTCALTHGDTLIRGGVPGKTIHLHQFESQLRQWNAARDAKSQIRLLALGHYHAPTMSGLNDGSMIAVNGSLCGNAPYAQSLGIHGHAPTQLIWESVPGHVVGDARFIRCAGVAHSEHLSGIVPIPLGIGSGAAMSA
jgi:hypothetical protein